MKRLIFCIVCTVVSVHLFAETTFSKELFPFLAEWQQTICTGYYDNNPQYTATLQSPQKEVLINNIPYLQMDRFFLREENGKILVYSEVQGKDLVLYDFTLELGDTLTSLNLLTAEHPEYSGTASVVDYPIFGYDTLTIDTLVVTDLSIITLLDGQPHKKWTFSNGLVYAESIGEINGDFFRLATDKSVVPGSYMGCQLVCSSQDGQTLYRMDQSVMDSLGVGCLCSGVMDAIEDTTAAQPAATKIIRNNQLLIQTADHTYTILGTEAAE